MGARKKGAPVPEDNSRLHHGPRPARENYWKNMSFERGEAFRLRIELLRTEAGLTQTAAAERAGIDVTVWNNLERGARTPRWNHVEAIMKAFGVTSLDFMFGLTERRFADEGGVLRLGNVSSISEFVAKK